MTNSFIKSMAAKTIIAVLKMLFTALKKTGKVDFVMITANVGENHFTNCKIGLRNIGETVPIIKSFEVINPACKSFYGNKTQRKACESLINEYGYDRVLFVVEKTLEITNQKEYLPNIQTPVQLFQKWSSLENGIKKIKNKSVTEQQKKGNVYW